VITVMQFTTSLADITESNNDASTTYELVFELRKNLNPVIATASPNRTIDRTGLDIHGVEEDFKTVVEAIKGLSKGSYFALKSCSFEEICFGGPGFHSVTKKLKVDNVEEVLKFAETAATLGSKFIEKFKFLSVQNIAVFGVLEEFSIQNKKDNAVHEHNKTGMNAMKPFILQRDSQLKCGTRDFFGSLQGPHHVIAKYFSSASIMPCSVRGNKIGILMTVTDKYGREDWSDGQKESPESPFNFPKREGKRRLCFLGGKRQYKTQDTLESAQETALREFKEEAGGVPERIVQVLQTHERSQPVIWLGSAKMVVFKVPPGLPLNDPNSPSFPTHPSPEASIA
jgi:hypothetical protein